MSKQQHIEDKSATVLRLAREAGGITYRNRAVQGTAIAFGPVALGRFVMALEEEATRDLLAALKAILADGLHCDVVPHLHERARAAIARAEGEA